MYTWLVSQLIFELLMINLMFISVLRHLLDMDKDNADCGILIEYTAATLDDGTLIRMFVSTQRINMEVCMRYAVKM